MPAGGHLALMLADSYAREVQFVAPLLGPTIPLNLR
jgi:hypothetical protein